MTARGDSATQFDPAAFDQAAQAAEKELLAWLATLEPDQVAAVGHIAAWWEKWFMVAGHKRLGRVLVRLARASQEGS